MTIASDFKAHFDAVASSALAELLPDEKAAINYSSESSCFMRFTGGKVRQTGSVEQATFQMKLYRGPKSYAFSVGMAGELDMDKDRIAAAIGTARAVMGLLPDDPYQVVPEAKDTSDVTYNGRLLPEPEIPTRVLDPAAGLDFTGIYSQGVICRGAANTAGARHWFATETFLLDYSAWLPNGKAVKSSYAGREWHDADYVKRLAETRRSLDNLGAEAKVLQPGAYRAFVTADALNEVIPFFSWNGLGEKGIRQGDSAFIALKEGRESFSPLFGLSQDFSLGIQPAFNDEGELAAPTLRLVDKGKLVNTLVSSRTAKQYGLPSNASPEEEYLRSASIDAGDLPEAKALEALGTGIYVSNFHYLNWSDPATARVTGMTRFACLWVQDGSIVGPIKDLRFDESLYNLLGAKLQAVTKERHLIVDSETYDQRSVGGSLLPGLLVDGLTFTL